MVLVPQAMAYALLAGLPPEIGLYAGILPLALYGLLGSSPVLSTGPAALVSLLVAASLGGLATAGSADYLALALTLAFACGLLQLLLGLARAGFLLNLLSNPVLGGFTSAAAIEIGLTQLEHVLGVELPPSERLPVILAALVGELPRAQAMSLLFGLAALGVLVGFERLLPRWLSVGRWRDQAVFVLSRGGPLAVVLLGTLAAWLLGPHAPPVVGEIPRGLPPLTLPRLRGVPWQDLLPAVLAISLVGFVQSFALAKTLASRRRQRVDANRELVAQGASNLAAAFSGGMPVAGSFSRSSLNESAGARTGLCSLVTAGCLALVALGLTRWFFYLPEAVLGAIILQAVVRLVDFRRLQATWRYSRAEALAWTVTFAAVLLEGLSGGIAVGVLTSLVLHIWRTSRPQLVQVGRLEGTEQFRDVERNPVRLCPHVLALRLDESLYFVNCGDLETRLLNTAADEPQLRAVVLLCSAVNFIDTSALETLERIRRQLGAERVELHLAEVKGPLRDRLERIGFIDRIGRRRLHLAAWDAWRRLGCLEAERPGPSPAEDLHPGL